jgi:hypothetical protein
MRCRPVTRSPSCAPTRAPSFDPGVVGQLVALVETSPDLYGAEEAIAL